jgi:heme-degrading monooxygenase HmoA
MFAVLFEVEPYAERWDDYLRFAGVLRPELLKIDGFLDNRRFASQQHPGRLLSLSFWRDEKSVIRWRTHGGHYGIQALGRSEIFRDYHLRVGEVVRENGITLPQQRLDETETGPARAACVLETPQQAGAPDAPGLVDWGLFDGITVPDSQVIVANWRDSASMEAWTPRAAERRIDIRIVRDYGLHQRLEAPQFHHPVGG